MAGFRRASHEQINVFEVDKTLIFKHYFDNDYVFDRVKQFYYRQQYRFSAPSSRLPNRSLMQGEGSTFFLLSLTLTGWSMSPF